MTEDEPKDGVKRFVELTNSIRQRRRHQIVITERTAGARGRDTDHHEHYDHDHEEERKEQRGNEQTVYSGCLERRLVGQTRVDL